MKKVLYLFLLLIYSCSTQGSLTKQTEEETTQLKEEMIYIPAGEFIMGSDQRELVKAVSFTVQHVSKRTVFLDAYYIAKHETTNIQFNQFLLKDGYKKRKYWDERGWKFIKDNNLRVPQYWGEKIPDVNSTLDYPNFPILGTSWFEASAYARWRGKRLPTEIEWEKAARGTDGRDYPWGNEFDQFKCNSVESHIGGTVLVGGYQKGVSPYGMMDMSGNIYEYTSDIYSDFKVLKSLHPDTDWGEGAAVLKGASWDDPAEVVKVWRRFVATVEERERGRHNGIRLAMDANE